MFQLLSLFCASKSPNATAPPNPHRLAERHRSTTRSAARLWPVDQRKEHGSASATGDHVLNSSQQTWVAYEQGYLMYVSLPGVFYLGCSSSVFYQWCCYDTLRMYFSGHQWTRKISIDMFIYIYIHFFSGSTIISYHPLSVTIIYVLSLTLIYCDLLSSTIIYSHILSSTVI